MVSLKADLQGAVDELKNVLAKQEKDAKFHAEQSLHATAMVEALREKIVAYQALADAQPDN